MLNKKSKLSILSKTLMTIFAMGGVIHINSVCAVEPSASTRPTFIGNLSGEKTEGVADNKVFENIGPGSYLEEHSAGAVLVYGGSTFESNSSQFIQNTAQNRGGAIYNGFRTNNGFLHSHVSVNGSIFKENTAGDVEYGSDGTITNILNGDGGAIYNGGVSTLVSENNSFVGNRATYGGAIYNGTVFEVLTSTMPKPEPGERLATLIFSGTNNFKNNMAGVGGAIVNRNYLQDTSDSEISFIGNTSFDIGGAIANIGNLDSNNPCDAIIKFTGKVNFIGNKTLNYNGGAVINYAASAPVDGFQTVISFEGETLFDSNHAENGFGGAVANQGVEIRFSGKQTLQNNVARYGGAIANYAGWKEAKAVVEGDTTFFNNTASWGAAIYNQSNLQMSGKQTFKENKADYGGAIVNYSKDAKVTIAGESTFSRNSALRGGAIYNQGGYTELSGDIQFTENDAREFGGAIFNNSQIVFGQGVRIFRDNSTGGLGGAIYNASSGNISFAGSNFFESNTANGVANDIFNNGQINFGGEENPHNITVLNGGVSGAGNMVLGTGRLVLGAGAQIHQGSFTAKAGTMTTVVLSDAHHVHDKNVAHFDELADENGTGHDKVATAVTNNGFGIHTTGEMTLEKGAVLNIVSDIFKLAILT